jgi:hypothetical protein
MALGELSRIQQDRRHLPQTPFFFAGFDKKIFQGVLDIIPALITDALASSTFMSKSSRLIARAR